MEVDKFINWIKDKPIAKLKSSEAVAFFYDIVYRFGVPNSIIIDNGTQFTRESLLQFCDDFHIRVDWVVVVHPKSNRQVERANGLILQCLKPRIFYKLKKFVGRWATELPAVLWSLRATSSRATGCTSLFLAFGAEACCTLN